jgi:4-hydroxy-3-polyprenylbenzoate decarboxylase
LASGLQLPVLFVSVKKDKPGQVKQLHEDLCKLPELVGIKMILYIEHTIPVDDVADVLWRLCNNLDPRRDHFYAPNGTIGLDGTRKTKELDDFERPWPNIIAADEETMAAVDKKWGSLGLGKIIFSPSLKYQTQLYAGGAAVLDNE